MVKINWIKEYRKEFVCYDCGKFKIVLDGSRILKNGEIIQMFRCGNCDKRIPASIKIPKYKQISDFACPECGAKCMRFSGKRRGKKREYTCSVCKTSIADSVDYTPRALSKIENSKLLIQKFKYEEDTWDLRNLLTNITSRSQTFFVSFDIVCSWFKDLVKKYVYHLCKKDTSPSTISKSLSSLRIFSRYLCDKELLSIEQINREIIIDFMIWDETGGPGKQQRLGVLRNFFLIGTIYGWFNVSQDIIRDEDYPKTKKGNPDPVSEHVIKQIENHLHQLPDPIVRMWLVAFFSTMRPDELALLKKDCLVQEGDRWKIVWSRSKVNDQHEIPITRTIAKVIQEQQEYIENLWGKEWNYLFCHYQGLSKSDPSQPDIRPVRKVIPKSNSPLTLIIRYLIKANNILDENGKPAKFSLRLVRPTRLTELFAQGHDLRIVSAWAGHRNLNTTALYYTHVSCEQIENEAGYIQTALFNADGQSLHYESLPKSFWKNPQAHKLEVPGDHINTPIYGYCGLPLTQDCKKFRACYTCSCFAATSEKLPLYIKTRDELRVKELNAKENGAEVLVEQFGRQAEQLDKIITGLKGKE